MDVPHFASIHPFCFQPLQGRIQRAMVVWPKYPGTPNLLLGTFANFIDCVRSRRKEDLNAPAEEGHISARLVHLADVSYRLGRTLRFDSATEKVIRGEETNPCCAKRMAATGPNSRFRKRCSTRHRQ